MATFSQFRCSVDGVEALARLRAAPLPLGLKAAPTEQSFHRDIYLDTSDRALARRAVSCRLRITADDRRTLCLILWGGADHPPERYEAPVVDLDPRRALEGPSEPARRLRGLVEPALLKPRIEIETVRWTRAVVGGWLVKKPRFAFLYDACTVRHGGLARTFEELQVRRLGAGGPHLEQIAEALEKRHGLRPFLMPKYERAEQLVEAIASEATVRMLSSDRAVVLLALDGGRLAFVERDAGLALPVGRGSGLDACRHVLRSVFDSGVGELTLLGQVSGAPDRAGLEVWVARRTRGRADGDRGGRVAWLTMQEALAKVGTPELRSPETLGALALAARMELVADPEPGAAPPARRSSGNSRPPEARHVRADAPAEHFLNVETSQLAFHERVLALAESADTPLAERLRYLAIVAGNLDEFFAVRVGSLKAAIANGSTRRTFDGLSPAEQFDAIAARVPGILARLARTARECLEGARTRGIRVATWLELDGEARAALTSHFEAQLLPVITPRAVTLSPGHPFPVIPPLTLAFAVLVRDVHTGPVHFAYLAIPSRLPRWLDAPGGELVPVEEVIRAHLQAFYPGRPVDQRWLFRLTRAADLAVADDETGDLVQVIEEEVQRRGLNAPVRIEVERGTPPMVTDLLMRELRFERRATLAPLGERDLYLVDGLMDPTCLRAVAARLPADDSFRPFVPRQPLSAAPSLFEQLDAGPILVHHPYEDFDATVGRFFAEAARDPDVVGIKLTLYRGGESSGLIDALEIAARQGKDVSVFVELRARFDEARNARWVRRLEEAGAHVAYGLAGLKIHAKCALVVRETSDGVRRYAHVGTGNYNPATARVYTDLGLLTADPAITADVGDLFNQLTGSTGAPLGSFRRIVVSPEAMVPALLAKIEREAALGERGRIRIQVNGLEDPELIEALYRASEAGASVDLVIRGLCLLRPGVAGLSARIRVVSVLGRLLEHQRIFHFGNDGADEYLIGSADLRPRNLRRRVEVLVPVTWPAHMARLDGILHGLLTEPSGWWLDEAGHYARAATAGSVRHVHDRWLEDEP
ncbi:MAG: polyphosphate kinase 1 [Gemmatimonadales bacterium]